MATKGAMNGVVVKQADYQAYEKRMALARSSFKDAQDKTATGWWALYEIDRDELYFKAHGYSKTEWVGELTTHEGISNGDFYKVMNMVRNFKKQRLADDTIMELLGKQMTALKTDLAVVFDKAGNLLPEAAEKIKAEHGSFGRMIQTLASQAPGKARQSVGELMGKDAIFVLDDATFFNPQRSELLFNVRWDDPELGLVGIYTVKVTVTNIAEGIEVKDRKHFPERLARWVGGKFGVKV